MNKKGFTLVELLAVILIISVLALIANTSVTKVVRDSKTDLYDSQLEVIKLAAESWGSENIDKLPDVGKCKYITLGNLKNYGLLDANIKNPKTDKLFDNDMLIKISSNETKYGTLKVVYEVDSNDVSECTPGLTKTICTISSESTVPSGSYGAKYNCKVDPSKDEYIFYLIRTNDDGTSDLIMNANINANGEAVTSNTSDKGNVAWASSGLLKHGPITAMTYLYNATKNWVNVDPLNYTYIVEITPYITTSYKSFISTNGIGVLLSNDGVTTNTIGTEVEPLRARMAMFSTNSNISDVIDENENNKFLYVNGEYWTLTPESEHPPLAYHTIESEKGYVSSGDSDSVANTHFGVRPIINVRL